MLVLLVEDEISFARLTMEYLETENIQCDHAVKGRQALIFLSQNEYDVILLDVNLPDMNGFDVCVHYRALGINTPTIMLTARSTLVDKSKGFNAGVDDYLVKPFAMEELVMRLNSLSQRGKRAVNLTCGYLKVNTLEHKAYINNTVLELSGDEWRLLLLLVSRKNEIINKPYIFQHIWPDSIPSEDAFKMLLFRLRKVLKQGLEVEGLSVKKIEIVTVRGIGIKLVES